MNIRNAINVGKKEIVKSTNSVKVAKDFIGEKFTMKSIVVYDNFDDEETDDLIVCAIGTTDGEFITTVSPTVKNNIDSILATFTEEEISKGIEVVFKTNKSNSGRDFIYLDLV